MHFLSLLAAVSIVSASQIGTYLDLLEEVIATTPAHGHEALTWSERFQFDQLVDELGRMDPEHRAAVLLRANHVYGGTGLAIGAAAGVATGGVVGGLVGAHIGRKNAEKKEDSKGPVIHVVGAPAVAARPI